MILETEARFWLRGERLDPQFWTNFFQRKSDIFKFPNENTFSVGGKILPHRLKIGFWSYSPADAPQGLSVDEQISSLTKDLGLPSTAFLEAIRKQDATCEFSVFVYVSGNDTSLKISDETTKLAAECGAEIKLDIWSADRTA